MDWDNYFEYKDGDLFWKVHRYARKVGGRLQEVSTAAATGKYRSKVLCCWHIELSTKCTLGRFRAE